VYEIGDAFPGHIDAAGSERDGPAPALPEAPVTGPARREPRITTCLALAACCRRAAAASSNVSRAAEARAMAR